MKRFSLICATGLGLGYMPFAPGTFGTLLAFPIALGLLQAPFLVSVLCVILFAGFSIWIADRAESYFNQKDASKIVIDEICGMILLLLGIAFDPKRWIAAFFLFRFFDVFKIEPARWIEKKCPGGYGVVLDDLMAAVYGRIVLEIIMRLGWL